ncbi:hypothetical protein nbrc107696_21800 [Gordonia spumicola]|uniref:DUF5313 domain-containing protein n=1 Tax=Gordonia spumicola TaxID=589161 RepID=A0A7I9V917_9ACTN|nr:DUF5313 family protein [Gordonia spumicola]GEE01734.1 hypothetical protein nbrc107696_21800 [Gordonia spumicola]
MSARPNPLQWIAYAYGAKLPEAQHDWVRNDLTGRFATPRHLIRTQFCFSPIYLAFYFGFDGEWWIRALMVLLAATLAFVFSVSYKDQNRVRRLQQHGLGNSPLTQRQRDEADAAKRRYEAVYAARRAS